QTQGQTSSVAFQATLIDGYAKTPLAGRTVQLSIGTGSASATTDATGNFQGTLPYTPGLGAAIASVFYAGDAQYLPGGSGAEVAGQPAVRKCTADSRGTDFWVMFPFNAGFNPDTGDPPIESLYITSDTATTGTVSAPGIPINPFNAAFSVTPGVATIITLPRNAQMTTS